MCAGASYWGAFSRVVYGCSSLQLERDLAGPGGFNIDIRNLYGRYAREGTRDIEVEGPRFKTRPWRHMPNLAYGQNVKNTWRKMEKKRLTWMTLKL